MKDYGNAIKYLRKKNQMTQTTLAEKLNISGQAVSKWENNLAQPDFDTIIKLTEIFNISLDEFTKLCSSPEALATLDDGEDEGDSVQEKESATNSVKQLIGVCSECGISIYDEESVGARSPKLICATCKTAQENRIKQEKLLKERKAKEEADRKMLESQLKKEKDKKKLRRELIIPAVIIALLLSIVLTFILIGYGEQKGVSIAIWSVIAVLAYLATAQILWANNAISYIFSWFNNIAFRMPGLIFELSIDGIIWAIAVKILFFILSGLLSVLLFLFSATLCLVLAPFFFPFSLKTLINDIKENII